MNTNNRLQMILILYPASFKENKTPLQDNFFPGAGSKPFFIQDPLFLTVRSRQYLKEDWSQRGTDTRRGEKIQGTERKKRERDRETAREEKHHVSRWSSGYGTIDWTTRVGWRPKVKVRNTWKKNDVDLNSRTHTARFHFLCGVRRVIVCILVIPCGC